MNPKWYVLGFFLSTLCLVPLVKFVYSSSFGCEAFSTSPDEFMAYCDSGWHAHYDHAAYLYDLEDGITDAVRRANLLALGSSRLQEAFSTPAVTTLKQRHPEVRPYVLGFGNQEQDKFSAAVLRRIRPTPQLVVINVDPFFRDWVSPPSKLLLDNPMQEEINARIKKVWHGISERACHGQIPLIGKFICGSRRTGYRSRSDGRWVWSRDRQGQIPMKWVTAPQIDEATIAEYLVNAEAYLSLLPVDRSCIVFTNAPTPETNDDLARELARRLGTGFIAPKLDGLTSTDAVHLDSTSSERWTSAVLVELEPYIKRCITQ